VTWLIGNVHVSVFKVFHPCSDTADAHMGIFVCAGKLPTDVSAELFSFTRNLNTAHWQNHVTDSHFVTVDCGNTSNICAPAPCSFWGRYVLLPILTSLFSNGTNVSYVFVTFGTPLIVFLSEHLL